MKYFLIIISIIVCSGCGRDANNAINEDFYPYVMKFKQYADNKGVDVEIKDLTIRFSPLGPTFCGICEHSTKNEPKTIEISHSCWDDESDWEREELLFHELGHCLLDKDHNSELREDHTPKSIMYPYVIGEYLYKKYYNEYIDELFL